MKHLTGVFSLCFCLATVFQSGCAFIPETRKRDVVHNPFPQLKRIAVLPFYNQSSEPTVDTDRVTQAYYAALQSIPGFEVLPVGVTKLQWAQIAAIQGEPQTGQDFQRLARQMGVEAVVVGSVTDFSPYYPPRMALTTHWYAANEGFHSIPAGYGLPWGTKAQEQIPQRIVREAEFELARSQLATQTPVAADGSLVAPVAAQLSDESELLPSIPADSSMLAEMPAEAIDAATDPASNWDLQVDPPMPIALDENGNPLDPAFLADSNVESMVAPLPTNWPDPTDLIPDPPSPEPPIAIPNHEPVLSHTKLYQGNDTYFTNRLADYVETGDDARPGGWQDYLKRSDDFIRFCCYLHVIEMLESRGGADQSDLILRWPLSRY